MSEVTDVNVCQNYFLDDETKILQVFLFWYTVVIKDVRKVIDILRKYRQDLHQIPERSLEEYKTKAYLMAELKSLGYNPIEVLDTGLLVYINKNSDETIAFRTDIDALPVTEENDIPFKSKNEGFMHACGHDGHMSILLGLANYLKDKKDKLNKNILLIFQPAEESIGGARLLCDLGIMEKYKVKNIFGIHLFPLLEQGIIGSRPNEFMAMANEIDITVHGKTAHGAMPQDGIDSNIILSKMLIEFQNIQSRIISPLEYTIITFGKMEGGSVRNVISDYAKMEGTIRSFSNSTQKLIVDSIKNIAQNYERQYECNIDVKVNPGYLPVVNDNKLYKQLKKALKGFDFQEFEKPFMIAEDFSFYQERVPGVFYFIGTKNVEKGYTAALHNSRFNFDEEALQIGLNSYITVLKEMAIINE